MTLKELMYMVFIDTLNIVNRYTIRKDVAHHDCSSQHIQCDMLERQCGAPWSLLLNERRRKVEGR